jgi:hypothetical protein
MERFYILIYTSNFSRCGSDNRAVSIALKSPDWYKGREYKRLAPPYWLLEDYHKNKDIESYSFYYYSDVLSRLNPCEIVNELGDDVILLCWESPSDFCHRHLVSEWLNKELDLGIEEYIEGGFL